MERFRQPKAMRTEAALFIDDDLQFDPHDIEFGFSVYQQFGRDAHRIVGYSGRQIYVDDRGTYSYDRYQSDFDIVLTNAAFLDTRALGWLRSRDPALRESIAYVDRHMNCEDILVNCTSENSCLDKFCKSHTPPHSRSSSENWTGSIAGGRSQRPATQNFWDQRQTEPLRGEDGVRDRVYKEARDAAGQQQYHLDAQQS